MQPMDRSNSAPKQVDSPTPAKGPPASFKLWSFTTGTRISTFHDASYWTRRVGGVLLAVALVGCGSTSHSKPGDGAGGQGGGAGESVTGGGNAGNGGMGQPDAACMAFCASSAIHCGGPDTEIAPTSSITATTPTGCSVNIMLAANGSIDADIDCVALQACVQQSGGGCLGSPGSCYDAEFESDGFSYQLDGCITGSVWCLPE